MTENRCVLTRQYYASLYSVFYPKSLRQKGTITFHFHEPATALLFITSTNSQTPRIIPRYHCLYSSPLLSAFISIQPVVAPEPRSKPCSRSGKQRFQPLPQQVESGTD